MKNGRLYRVFKRVVARISRGVRRKETACFRRMQVTGED